MQSSVQSYFQEMEKADIERHMHCNIKFLNMSNSTIGGFTWNYKHILKETKPEWPKILELATKTKLILNLKKSWNWNIWALLIDWK